MEIIKDIVGIISLLAGIAFFCYMFSLGFISPDKEKEPTAKELAGQIVLTLYDAGLSPDEMLEVIRMAREKVEQMKKEDGKNKRLFR